MESSEIKHLKRDIKKNNILKKYQLKRIGIFGSLARGEKYNDIDLYIDKDDFNTSYLPELKESIEKITNKRVDVMLKKYANPIVLYRAKKDMIYVDE